MSTKTSEQSFILLHIITALCLLTSAGCVPATGFLKPSGIHLDSKGFITVNKVFDKSNFTLHFSIPFEQVVLF